MGERLTALSQLKEGANNSQTAINLNIRRRTVNDGLIAFMLKGLKV